MSSLLKASSSHVSSKRIPPFDCLYAFEHLIIMQQCMKAWPFVQQLLPPSAWQVSLPLIYQLSDTVWGALFWKCARHTFSDWDEYWTLECDILHRVSQFLHVSCITHSPAFLNQLAAMLLNIKGMAWQRYEHVASITTPKEFYSLRASLILPFLSIVCYKDCILIKSQAFVEFLFFFCVCVCVFCFPTMLRLFSLTSLLFFTSHSKQNTHFM